ncbi:rolling circle replication-associated protein [Anaeromassilibacillus senegalensis]|uniref:rolling circle replication-associated protein n=1 Tax=Anaeromassilibacillus senegalensis TaxID=1673717 RepID=UPI000680BC3E|nr:hypothetical protein [Anaeromassilibacillus senegalensis]
MGYRKKTYRTGPVIEIEKTYYVPRSQERASKAAATAEAVKKNNDKLARRELTRQLTTYFTANDWFLALTYRKEERPDPETAKKQMKKFWRDMRKLYAENGQELFYISTTAIGSRGGIHHHAVVNYIDLREIKKLWPYGQVRPVLTYMDGAFAALADYIIDQNKTAPDKTEIIPGRRWSHSRNIKKVEPKIEEVSAKEWKKEPQPLKGYRIILESVENGVNPITGIPYQFYRMIRIRRRNKSEQCFA